MLTKALSYEESIELTPGDQIYVRPYDDILEDGNYYPDGDYIDFGDDSPIFVTGMEKYCEKGYTIKGKDGDWIMFDDNFYFGYKMLTKSLEGCENQPNLWESMVCHGIKPE